MSKERMPDPFRDAILAEVAKSSELPPETKEAPPEVETQTETQTETESEETPSVETQSEEQSVEEQPPVETKPEEPADTSDKPDPQRSKWLEQRHREEKAHKQALAQRERDFEAKWGPLIQKAEQYEREVKPLLNTNPLRALLAHDPSLKTDKARLGRLGAALTALYRGAEDPKYAEVAEREVRSLEVEDRITAAERRAAEAEARVKRFEVEQRIDAHLLKAVSAVDDKLPAVKSLLANDPDEARTLMRQVGDYLTEQNGEWPTPRQIAEGVETIKRQELKKLGIDPETYYAPKAPPKPATQNADKTKTARTLPGNLGTPTTPKAKPRTSEEFRDEILREHARLSAGG